jgi:hypothetical protein
MKADMATLAGVGMLAACQGSGAEFVLEPSNDAPAVADYGVLEVIPADEWDALGPQEAIDTYGIHEVLGAPETGHFGGGTFRFLGNGDDVCVLTDMELVFWSQSISPVQPIANFQYPDNYNDDGDIDLFAGISAFYTGSPGVEMGDFYGVYTDSQGQQTTIAYNECLQNGAKAGFNESHAGRATAEFCTLDTNQREGVEFTVALQTFAVPLDDGKMDFVAAVVGESCNALAIDECTYLGEKFIGDSSEEDYEVEVIGMENAWCALTPSQYCCEWDDDYPDLCGDPPDTTFCEQFEKKDGKKK